MRHYTLKIFQSGLDKGAIIVWVYYTLGLCLCVVENCQKDKNKKEVEAQ